MKDSQKILSGIFVWLIGAGTAYLTNKLVQKAWRATTGQEPPEPYDSKTRYRDALMFSTSIAVLGSIVDLTSQRYIAKLLENYETTSRADSEEIL